MTIECVQIYFIKCRLFYAHKVCGLSYSIMSNSLRPMDCSPQGFSVHGIFQAKTLKQVAISYSKESFPHRDWSLISWVSCIGRQILDHCTTWEKQNLLLYAHKVANCNSFNDTKYLLFCCILKYAIVLHVSLPIKLIDAKIYWEISVFLCHFQCVFI